MDYNQLTYELGKYGGVIALIVFGARIVVKLTPTPKDDTWLQTVVDILKHIGLTIPGSTDKGPNGGNQGTMPGGTVQITKQEEKKI